MYHILYQFLRHNIIVTNHECTHLYPLLFLFLQTLHPIFKVGKPHRQLICPHLPHSILRRRNTARDDLPRVAHLQQRKHHAHGYSSPTLLSERTYCPPGQIFQPHEHYSLGSTYTSSMRRSTTPSARTLPETAPTLSVSPVPQNQTQLDLTPAQRTRQLY